MANEKRIAIVGGGIAGLSAGIFAQMNGFEAHIYEAGSKPGGVCASWHREGYTINGSIHWLVGSAPGSDFYDMWEQLGILPGGAIYDHDVFMVFEDVHGKNVYLYTQLPKLKAHLLELAPEDEEPICDFIGAIETFTQTSFPMNKSMELFSFYDWGKAVLQHFSILKAFYTYGNIDLHTYAQKFSSPILREVFEQFWHPRMSMQFMLIQLGYAAAGAAGYPIGGSGPFAKRLAERFAQLGGVLHLQAPVKEIRVAESAAVGVLLHDGSAIDADYVVAACDLHTLAEQLLPPNRIPLKIRDALDALEPFPSLFYFVAGFARTFPTVRTACVGTSLKLANPLVVGSTSHTRVNFQFYTFDPTLAPTGHTLVTAMVHTDFETWEHWQQTGQLPAERDRLLAELIRVIETHFPGSTEKLVFTEAATPLTYTAYTGNFHGSYEGWLPTPEAAAQRIPTHWPQVRNLYLAGHWVAPGGGMPPAAYTGRNAIQLICKEEQRAFRVQVT